MKCKCPACGATFSLDVLLQHEHASQALFTALHINGELGKLLIHYLGLFRPKKTALTMDRVAHLLDELLPMLENQSIMRNGQQYHAPIECWLTSLQSLLNQRHSLKLPLKSHGYLLEIIANWQPKPPPTALVATTPQSAVQNQKVLSKTSQAICNLAEWANEKI